MGLEQAAAAADGEHQGIRLLIVGAAVEDTGEEMDEASGDAQTEVWIAKGVVGQLGERHDGRWRAGRLVIGSVGNQVGNGKQRQPSMLILVLGRGLNKGKGGERLMYPFGAINHLAW